MKKRFGVNHAIAECEDCEWRTEAYKNAQANAARHARKYGHRVLVDIGMSGYYDGREEES